MKITEDFVATIEKLQYASFENQNKFEKENEPIMYVCNATISEVGRGLSRFKQYHNIALYLTKEQFEELDGETKKHTFIEKGDRIRVLAGSKWQSTPFEYTSYNKSVIEKVDRSKLSVDANGKTYFSEKVFSYKIIAKKGDWEMERKWYDQNFCTIAKSRVKLPLTDKKQFQSKTLEFFLEPMEMRAIEDLHGEVVKLIAYSNGNKFGEKDVVVYAKVDSAAGVNYLLLEDVEGLE